MSITTQISVLDGGLQTTLQDLGRSGGRRYGIPPGGALDRAAHLAANKLVFNQPEAATLEITLRGPRLLFETAALIAITGADYGPTLNNRAVPMNMSVFVRAGQILEFAWPVQIGGKQQWGRVCYLAIQGGFSGPCWLQSRSTYLKARLSGYKGAGRPIGAGDVLENGEDFAKALRHPAEGAGRALPESEKPNYSGNVQVRLIKGPYQENFNDETYQTLLSQRFTLMEQSDRMGFRLSGPVLAHRRPELSDIASCAAVFGAIQVPSNGQPIVLMADHQVTGGYPIIATVLSADLPLLAQLLPGGTVSFTL